MIAALRPTLQAFRLFLRTPSLSRSVVMLLTGAIILLMVVNLTVFAMIRRTVDFNATVESGQNIRLTANAVLSTVIDAEGGQRGFLLTGRLDHLESYTNAAGRLDELFDELDQLTAGDPELIPRVQRLREMSGQRLDLIERTVVLARTGRALEALVVVRSGQGKTLMDRMRVEVLAINEIQATRFLVGTRQTEWAANLTLGVNGFAGLLILGLGGISGWLIRRYVIEIQAARQALDRMNAGLELQVRNRTFELTRANEEVQRFAYIVSHDLRAPLVNVMGYTAELEQAGRIIDRQMTAVETRAPNIVEQDALTAVREDVPEAIGFIRASTEKMDRLINAILKLSREGRRNLTPELLDVTAMVQAIADSVRHQTLAAGEEIVVEALPRIETDRLSLEQVFGNLIDNAVKYLDPARPGRIVVTGEIATDGKAVYRITDNGRGISDRDHERIFELFRRSGKQDRPGEGLGLAFVRNSVRRLGGDITLESKLGTGSTFTLKFPTRLILTDTGEVE